MSQADSAIIAVAVLIPILLVGRRLVRIRRRQPFGRDELVISFGALAVGAVVVLTYQSRLLITWVPSMVLLAGGLYLLASERDRRASQLTRLTGVLAFAVGMIGLVAIIARSLLGG